jgi:hypothetical protein
MFATDFTPVITIAGASGLIAGERTLRLDALLPLSLPIGCRA